MTELVKAQNTAAMVPGTVNGGNTGGGDTHQYLTFNLSSEMFAVGILNVKKIIEYGTGLTLGKTPHSQSYVVISNSAVD